MTIYTNIDGSWRNVSSVKTNVDGAWREVTKGDVNIGGSYRTVFSKTAGLNWATRRNDTTDYFVSVCYSDALGLFCAISKSPNGIYKVATSPDGITWALGTPPSTGISWNSVCYGNGYFVTVASGTETSTRKVATSIDGSTWTNRTGISNASYPMLCYGETPKLFVASADNTDSIMTSPTGVSWTLRTSPANVRIGCMCWGDGRFVGLPSTYDIYGAYSSNGTSWTALTNLPATNNTIWRSICYGNGLYVAVAAGSNINNLMTSSDGVLWTPRTTPVFSGIAGWKTVCYGNGAYIAIGSSSTTNAAISSTDGINWAGVSGFCSPSSAKTLESICYGNGIFVAVGKGQILTSD